MTLYADNLTSDLTPAPDLPGQGQILTAHEFFVLKWFLVTLQAVVCLFGLVTNIINVVVFGKMGVAESATSLSFFSLAVSDLGFVATYSVYVILLVYRVFGYDVSYNLFVMFSWMFFYNVSTAITVYVSLQKMFCVAIPFRFKNVFTLRRTAVVLLVTTVVIASFYVPVFATLYIGEFRDSLNNTTRLAVAYRPGHRGYRRDYEISMQYLLPFSAQVIVIICLIVLFNKLSRASNFRRQNLTIKTTKDDSANSGAFQLSGKELQAVKAVLVVAAMFVTCNLPPVRSTTASLLEPDFQEFGRYFRLFFAISYGRFTLMTICSSLNIVVYATFNSNFRHTLKAMSPSCWREENGVDTKIVP
ncbi:lysophosphatidic acid receptor 4 [Aplysia californica]|uniref:Lysophosphatidic acid receptor 4 n=1 Tax=Aplysia californica TaxID=6500 RepID=A0ABM0JY88_APLCA|nr:lysophosphatidic acid receptor 4 [Aplysia californica]